MLSAICLSFLALYIISLKKTNLVSAEIPCALSLISFVFLCGLIFALVVMPAPTPENEAELAKYEARQARIVETLTEIADLDYPDPTLPQIINAAEGKVLAGDLRAEDYLAYHQVTIRMIEELRKQMYVDTPTLRWWIYFGQ